MQVQPEIWGGDRAAAARHVHNFAARQGWHPHSLTSHGLALVLPERDLPALLAMEQDAYRWIEQNRGGGAAPSALTGAATLRAEVSFDSRHNGRALLSVIAGALAAFAGLYCAFSSLMCLKGDL